MIKRRLGHRFWQWITLITAGILLLTACVGQPGSISSQNIPGLAETLAAQTLAAPPGGSRFRDTPTPQPTQAPVQVVAAQAPAENQPEAEQSNQPTHVPGYDEFKAGESPENCTNAAQFVKDISVPDGARIKAGQRFTKTWQFKNVGTCAWSANYKVSYVWGDQLAGFTEMPLPKVVAPGETVDISIPMIAPSSEGMFQSNFLFMDEQGNTFGTGYRARDFFWVSIDVAGSYGNASGGICGGGG